MHPRRTRFGPAGIACALAAGMLAAVLSGCAAAPVPVPTKTADAAAPIFATDEEALAAAEEAYAAYQEIFDGVAASGGMDTSGLSDVSHGEALDRALDSARKFVENSVHTSGNSAFGIYKPESLEYSSEGDVSLRIYVCDDVSGLVPVDANGNVIRPTGSAQLVPFVIELGVVPKKGLVLVRKELWVGDSFC